MYIGRWPLGSLELSGETGRPVMVETEPSGAIKYLCTVHETKAQLAEMIRQKEITVFVDSTVGICHWTYPPLPGVIPFCHSRLRLRRAAETHEGERTSK